MNVAEGKVIGAKESMKVLDALPQRILKTLAAGELRPEIVIEACDALVHTLEEDKALAFLADAGVDSHTGRTYLAQMKSMFGKEYLQARVTAELGLPASWERQYTPPFCHSAIHEKLHPLGVLVHIAAGNADGLPAFSVLEGLLTGNINILKLPDMDGGLSVFLLTELIRIEPRLADYIYVFDYRSKDTYAIAKLLDVADAVVVWGGDFAVSALRKLVKPNTKLIEWGHKISFAYMTPQGSTSEALRGLAQNICTTNQLLCSSCQGIYIDTDSPDALYRFCEEFLPLLQQTADSIPLQTSLDLRAQTTLQVYTAELEQAYKNTRVFRDRTCSLTVCTDALLEPSIPFRNCWVKPLPRHSLLSTLRPHKNHLQTAALLCGKAEQAELTRLLWKAGVVRVTNGAAMSSTYCGEPHDGEYPLRRYVRVVSLRQE